MEMAKSLENPFYYLENFDKVLGWISQRYGDLLNPSEQEFIDRFATLPQASRALLVRMVMRKGELFRSSKLHYEEIGCTHEAARPLLAAGWIDDNPPLSLEQFFSLVKKDEIGQIFHEHLSGSTAKKAEQLEVLRAEFADPRPFSTWHAGAGDCVYQVRITDLCERLRLMFFGNLHQGWTEFVLSDLGIFKYEKVEFSAASRGFLSRADVDDYLHLYRCKERFRQGEPLDEILVDIPVLALNSDWLENRRAKLLFQIGQQYEKLGEWASALNMYAGCSFPGARVRGIRVLERCEQVEQAFDLALNATREPESEAEKQQLLRIMPRLRRKLGRARVAACPAAAVPRIDLVLPPSAAGLPVEILVRDHLQEPGAPVFYVENALINSLFGLLCWNAIFTALPGAFFHPFHTGPADLYSQDFHRRRQAEFARCLAQLDTQQYKKTIRENFVAKAGVQSPFVFWGFLDHALLELALACLPPEHLGKCFTRILLDIKSNRTGFPDLIQFWPDEGRYRMIEVKGPGDRLQDNQIRWLDYCAEHGIPVMVCYVQWAESAA